MSLSVAFRNRNSFIHILNFIRPQLWPLHSMVVLFWAQIQELLLALMSLIASVTKLSLFMITFGHAGLGVPPIRNQLRTTSNIILILIGFMYDLFFEEGIIN